MFEWSLYVNMSALMLFYMYTLIQHSPWMKTIYREQLYNHQLV